MIGVLGFMLILISVNPRNTMESIPHEASYDEMKIYSLSVHNYRPIFIEKRFDSKKVYKLRIQDVEKISKNFKDSHIWSS